MGYRFMLIAGSNLHSHPTFAQQHTVAQWVEQKSKSCQLLTLWVDRQRYPNFRSRVRVPPVCLRVVGQLAEPGVSIRSQLLTLWVDREALSRELLYVGSSPTGAPRE
jgi:hypothetical protein